MSDYLESLFSLKGKVAVVIGGTGELCGTMAEGLASAGADIVLVGRNPDKAADRLKRLEKLHGKSYFVPCHVEERASLEGLLDKVLEKSGQVDILVNGAGVNSPTPFLEIQENEYEKIMDVNLKAVFLACQIFGRYFVERGKPASIINVGSISGLNPISRVFTYSASKGAVHNLTKNLAREWAPLNIRVNTLVPGFFPAEQNRRILTPDRVEQIMGHTPMKRFGNSEELIGATLLLASEKAGSFITGHDMIVDGGFASMRI
jgi:NAD(P)-dependent dehydrogenase (short-subunit alcohol dehydrogenase family)